MLELKTVKAYFFNLTKADIDCVSKFFRLNINQNKRTSYWFRDKTHK